MGWYIWHDIAKRTVSPAGEPVSGNEATTTVSVEPGEGQPVVTVEKIDPPNLDKPIVITADMSAENAAQAKKHIEEVTKALKDDGTLYNHWLELANYRKLIGDSTSAVEIWQYITAAWPNESVAFANLSNFYAESGDFKKAEENILIAIEKTPGLFTYYYMAYEFYRYYIKDLTKAKNILLQGKQKNPYDQAAYDQVLATF